MKFPRATLLLALALVGTAMAQYDQSTPIPILKQINRHNEDGSYSYGYEAADGSYKIETKHPTGEVYGKYGYVDDTGKSREIEYGATRRGFEPIGTDISVAPPTISQQGNNDYEDDGQYREDPRMYYQENEGSTSGSQSGQYSGKSRFESGFGGFPARPAQRPVQQAPQYVSRPAPVADAAPRRAYPADPTIFRGHPASNFNVNTGSYSVSYAG